MRTRTKLMSIAAAAGALIGAVALCVAPAQATDPIDGEWTLVSTWDGTTTTPLDPEERVTYTFNSSTQTFTVRGWFGGDQYLEAPRSYSVLPNGNWSLSGGGVSYEVDPEVSGSSLVITEVSRSGTRVNPPLRVPPYEDGTTPPPPEVMTTRRMTFTR